MPPFITVSDIDQVDLSFSNAEYFSTRSSYSAEDGTQHSFAGQFKTVLNVKRSDVKQSVQTVMDSFAHAKQYKKAHGINENGHMQVIVQEMVVSDVSGVIFTANPQGILNEIVIVVGKGTGDNVVADKTPTTTYYYNKTDDVYYYETNDTSPVLEDDMVQTILNNAKKIQALFNFYADIEFCIKDNCLYFLQVRPITALNTDNKIILDSSNISESYPGITLPATQSFAKQVYHTAFKSCVGLLIDSKATLNKIDDVLLNMVECSGGRMYYQINNWYFILKLLPFSSKIIPIWQEMLGVLQKDVYTSANLKPSIFLKAKILVNFIKYLIVTPKQMAKLNDYFTDVFKHYKKEVQEKTDSESLFNLCNEMHKTIGEKWGITLINDMYAFIFTFLAKRKYMQKLNNIHKLESLKPVHALDSLAKCAKKYGINSDEYKAEKMQYLDLYGDRCLEELKLETVTPSVTPFLLDEQIKNYEFNELNKEVESKIEKQTEKEPFFLRCAKMGIYNREISRMNRTRLYGLARKIYLKIGQNFVNKNIIQKREDIFYLHLHEIESCIKSETDMKDVVAQRTAQYNMYKQLPTFTRLVFASSVFSKTPVSVNNQIINRQQKTLVGTPSSAGSVTASVIVINSPSLNINTKGKIIVTTVTDPGWVFLIKNCAGVIAEKGSLLSHTAIITRELEKPCCVGVTNATKLLKTGDVVSLNGTTGEIEIITE